MTENLKQLNILSHLLLLQAKALEARSLDELAFVLVNDTRQLLSYDTALFYHHQLGKNSTRSQVKAISDVASFDARSEYVIAQAKLAHICMDICGEECKTFHLDDLQLSEHNINRDYIASEPYLLWLPLTLLLKHKEGGTKYPVGGLLLMRKVQWKESEKRILKHWQQNISHSLVNLHAQAKLISKLWYNQRRRKIFLATLLFIPLILSIPVPLSVIAPAEIIPLEPEIVRSPIAGVISTLHIVPNEQVVIGKLLISLDDRELKTKLQVADQARGIALAELQQAQQSALFDAKAKAALPVLRMRVEQQQAEYEYTENLLVRSKIKANSNGVAILNNANEMLGRPVVLGERLLTLAQLDKQEVQIWLPVSDEIPLQEGDAVVFYPETAPNLNINAVIHHIAYQATETSSAGLAYQLLATIESSQQANQLRIGMRGSARIFNMKVSLFYYLFHKPLSKLRSIF